MGSKWLANADRTINTKSAPIQPIKADFFEKKFLLSHESFIAGCIDQTHVMIEQKGSNKDLDKPIRQSSGELLIPFQQT